MLSSVVTRHRLIALCILLVGVFLIFFRITRADMVTDESHYAFRSIDLVDYVASDRQTTPIQWFGSIPWWSRLSFHDAPPLVFWIQHFFFSLFGVNLFVARLPFALAGMCVLILVYLIGTELYNSRVGLVAMGFMTINPYFLWSTRIGLLEGIELVWILAGIYWLLVSRRKPSYLFLAAIGIGFALLSKYTALYLVPVIGVYVWMNRKTLFADGNAHRRTALGCLILMIMVAPLVIYNLEMMKSRGHFDMQFAVLFHQSLADWPSITRTVNANVWSFAPHIMKTLMDALSPLGFSAIIVSMIALLVETIRIRTRKHMVVMLNIVFLFVMFSFIGFDARYLSLFVPFFALSLGYVGVMLWTALSTSPHRLFILPAFVVVGIVFGMGNIAYAYNTNHAYVPWGERGVTHGNLRIENKGFVQLDEYLDRLLGNSIGNPLSFLNVYQTLPGETDRVLREAQSGSRELFSSIIVYDENLNWFARIWLFDRRIKQHHVAVYSFANTVYQGSMNREAFSETGSIPAYIILPEGRVTMDPEHLDYTDRGGVFRSYVAANGVEPIERIVNPVGELAFSVYRLDNVWPVFDTLYGSDYH